MNAWRKVRLDQVFELQRGHDLPIQDRVDGEIPILGSNGIVGYHNDARYSGPGVTIGRSGVIGGANFVEGKYWPLNTCLFVKDFLGNDARWVYYWLKSMDFTAMDSGSAQPSLNRNYIAGFPVILPPLSQQRAIAAVLGALDDKIAANTLLAATADELAEALFRQALPSAVYTDETFADLAKVSGGGTPSTKEPSYWDGTVSWATPTDITGLSGPYLETTSRTISEAGLKACSSELYPAGSILMTSRATIGAFALAQIPTAVNQGFIVVQPNDPAIRFWIFHEMRSRVDEFISLANGATFLELSRGNFKKFKVRKASLDIMRSFSDTAAALHKMAQVALTENNSLAATRDALLPNLMSGKLSVRDTEALVETMI